MVDETWLGRRVVLRRAVNGGSRTADVLGDLVDAGAARLVVETAGGPVEVAPATVVAARIVEASTAAQLDLEQVAARGWRAREEHTLDGWLLRADAGWTGRANSALPLRSARSNPDQLAAVGDWYAARGLPARLAVPTPARELLDRYLVHAGGWTQDEPVEVRTVRVDLAAGRATAHAGDAAPSTLADRPDDDWLAVFRGGTTPPAGVDLLSRHDRAVFVSREVDGRTVATARGVVDDGWLGVTAVEVDPAHRHRGHAVAVMRDVLQWGAARSAAHAYLQVTQSNAAAIALYERLGTHVHHRYSYWTQDSG